MDIEACFASGYTAEGIIGKRKNSKDAPLLRDLIQDTWVLIEEEKKALVPGGLKLRTSIDYVTFSPTHSPPALPK